ncbi:flagellar basal-body rod protein FlgG [Paramaledivibacter caminithermalis]|uniref:Flagellar basal-body rod protein FlgG n=1 Tax=Paramaledivibacter caminithermalis (strain DSM 15212 / CIP 107654 / DViRD3) TaxID=1121301 RepID=A0A1M6L496_PARC5|nr:flagellar basal-body rod protein FlgG [Paramaledivibacter caminithermalis]SHJ65983.1 flagellar basal-body rod protein FlgG [Paramaledivibacter caminithermalis DSM 15212]
MRALWTAASGMKAQQLNIDTISNNLSNVNTTGYKKQRIEFKDLMYEKLRRTDFNEGEGKPVNLEVGHGVMPAASVRSFTEGSFEQTNNNLDLAINGQGFFVVRDNNDNLFFTRDGSFKLSIEDGEARIATADGYFVQSDIGDIELGRDISDIFVSPDGVVSVKRTDTEEIEEIAVLQIVKFPNPAGLESIGKNLFKETTASGQYVESFQGDAGEVLQGFLETSNVQVVEEMIKLITAQRAYEVNSKSIQTSDEMLQMANNLRR